MGRAYRCAEESIRARSTLVLRPYTQRPPSGIVSSSASRPRVTFDGGSSPGLVNSAQLIEWLPAGTPGREAALGLLQTPVDFTRDDP